MLQQSKHLMTETYLNLSIDDGKEMAKRMQKNNKNIKYCRTFTMNAECTEHLHRASSFVIAILSKQAIMRTITQKWQIMCVLCARTSTMRYRNILIFANRRAIRLQVSEDSPVLLHTIIGTILVQCTAPSEMPQFWIWIFLLFFLPIRTCCQLIWTIFHYDMMHGARCTNEWRWYWMWSVSYSKINE